jgi:DNA-binding NarL/FixJ family response regulator
MQPTILLADDHVLVRQGLRALLEDADFPVVGEASDGREATDLARELKPDVAVLDLCMPLLNGIDAAVEIVRAVPSTRTILLTMHTAEQFVLRALRSGLHGYVLKSEASACLIQAIHEAVNDRLYLGPGVPPSVLEAWLSGKCEPGYELSSRERQILQLVAEGRSTKEVATLLGISPKTVETYRARIMVKIGLHDTPGLVRYAVRNGLIDA